MRSAARTFVFSADQAFLPIGEAAPAPAPQRKVPVRAHLRTVGGDAPPSGQERKAKVLDSHQAREVTHRCVAYVRAELRGLYRSRVIVSPFASDHYVTADDVETILGDWADCPDEAKPSHGPQHWRGAVFRGKGWRQIPGRTVPSVRPHMNATALPCWEPTDLEVP